MDRHARKRWTVLLLALAATIGAIFYPVPEGTGPAALSAASVHAAKPATLNVASFTTGDAPQADGALAEIDPFAPRGWQAPPPPAPPAQAMAAPAAVAAIDLAPVAPALPFRYVGRLNDDTGQTVYLARGEQTYAVHGGDALDSTYRIVDINALQVEFEHIPTSTRQVLAIPAADN